MLNAEWLLCPICKNKTRIKLRYDTVLNLVLSKVQNRNFNSCQTIQSVSYHRARRFRRRADNPLASRHTDYRLFSFDSISDIQ